MHGSTPTQPRPVWVELISAVRGRVAELFRRLSKLRGSRWALPGTLALSLCGCTTLSEYVHNGFKVGPNYKRPPAPVAQHWIDAGDVRVRSEEADDRH